MRHTGLFLYAKRQLYDELAIHQVMNQLGEVGWGSEIGMTDGEGEVGEGTISNELNFGTT